MKTKNKTKKIHFRLKTKKAENDQIAHFRRRKRLLVGFLFDGLTWVTWPPHILRQIYATAKNDGGGGGNCSYKWCKASVKSSLPTNQHPAFYRLASIPVTQPTVSEHWGGKVSYSTDLLTPSSPGVFQPCLWPLWLLVTLEEGCQAYHNPIHASTPQFSDITTG